jgi:signal transduction histidine kinase
MFARIIWLGIALVQILASEAPAAEPHRVLLLHAFGHAYSPWSDFAASFRAELIKKSPEPIDLYEVSLDTARVQNPQEEGPFIDYIRALLAGRKLDLIVPVGAPAAFFMQRHRPQLFATTPMLILGADVRRTRTSPFANNETGVLLDLDLPAYLRNILRLRPETTEIAVVVGNSPVERYWTSELQRDFQTLAMPVKVTWPNDMTLNEMLAYAAAMPPRSAIFWFLLSEDAQGVPYSEDRALDTMRAVAAVPIFGMADHQLGRGIVGGPLMQTRVIGQEGADVALRILKGEAPSNLKPPLVLFGAPVYDDRELRRWGISKALLPEDAVVQYRQASIWEQYRWVIMGVAATILFQSMLIAYVILQSARRRAAEAETALQRQEVAHLMRVSVMGELSGAIAHEINQPLTAIQSNVESGLQLMAGNPLNLDEIREVFNDIAHDNRRAAEVIQRLRDLLKKGERRSDIVDVNDLVNSTMALLNSELIGRRISVRRDLADPLPKTMGDPVQLQQVLLNLVMNAMDAMVSMPIARRAISISTRAHVSRAVEILVEDRGIGIRDIEPRRLFEPFYTTKSHGLGLGLSICSTIIEAHGGSLKLINSESGGAIATMMLPALQMFAAAK